MTDATLAATPSRHSRSRPAREVWLALQANKGAMAGLIVIVVLVHRRRLRRRDRAPSATPKSPSECVTKQCPPVWQEGSDSALFRWAPTRSAADLLSQDHLRLALFAVHRHHRRHHLAGRRHPVRPDVRILPRHDRHPDHAGDGHHPVHAQPAAGAGDRRDPRLRPGQRHDRGRHHLHSALCAPGARRGADRTAEGLCHGLARRRRRHAAADAERGAAELPGAADRAGDLELLHRDPRRGGARLPRPMARRRRRRNGAPCWPTRAVPDPLHALGGDVPGPRHPRSRCWPSTCWATGCATRSTRS